MKNERDMDFIRDLLLRIEGGKTYFETMSAPEADALMADVDDALSEEDAHRLSYHLGLLEEHGFIVVNAKLLGGAVSLNGMTWAGHDFLYHRPS